MPRIFSTGISVGSASPAGVSFLVRLLRNLKRNVIELVDRWIMCTGRRILVGKRVGHRLATNHVTPTVLDGRFEQQSLLDETFAIFGYDQCIHTTVGLILSA
ncbi:hypothetical protein BG61_10200 [Caballeronia glathei]|uniref:Uncharacterized protein n=1 Tax=Caballeronia glathei TaxID=60547 RepID=A0A069PCY3_9BURK|nr:hypothetical protein BG61_10200 [Caballeronia glathei]